MCDAKKERRRVLRGTSLAASSVLLSTILLAGCASVGDALNPVEWYNGVFGSSDRSASAKENPPDEAGFPVIPNDKRPDVSSNKARTELSKGLAADHSNAKYTQEVLRREGNPTRPLSVEASVAPKEAPTPAAATPSPAPVSSSVLLKQQQPAVASAPVAATASEPAVSEPTASTAPSAAPEPAAPPPAPTPTARPKQDQSRAVTPQAAPDVAALPAKPSVAVDDEPPPPPPKLSAGGVVPTPAAAQPTVTASTSSAPPTPAPTPAPVPAAASAPAVASAPVQVAAATAVPAMTAPATMPPAAASVEEVYRQRLAEFASGTVPAATPTAAPAVKPIAPAAVTNDTAPGTLLISPAEYRRKLAHDNGGARPLEAFDGSRSAASFEVAAVRFGEGTAELSAGEQQHLKEVAALYREKGGSVRILGRSASPRLEIDAKANQLANRQLAGGRAAAIARELIKLGVPARKIFAGAASSVVPASAPAPAASGETTEIYIDY